MHHPLMRRAAEALEARGISAHRFDFPYMQAKKSRPDPPAVAEDAVRKAVAEAARQAPGLPIFAGGKAFRGLMTSQAQGVRAFSRVSCPFFFRFPAVPPSP